MIRDDKYGLLDYRGKIKTPLVYKSVSGFDHYLIVLTTLNKLGVLDKKGREILPAIYDEIEYPETPPKTIFKDFE